MPMLPLRQVQENKMSKLNWLVLSEKMMQRSPRERIGFLLVGWVMVGFPLWFWWMQPTLMQWQKTKQQVVEQQVQLQQMNAARDILNARLQQDPDQAVRQELQAMTLRLQQLDQALASQTVGLIPASRMAGTLQDMLVRSGKLQLQSLTSLKPTPLLPEKSAVNYYRHGVKLILQGRYADIYDYLRMLEALPQHFYWQSLHYQVDQYPLGTVEVILYTLGDSKEFIRG